MLAYLAVIWCTVPLQKGIQAYVSVEIVRPSIVLYGPDLVPLINLNDSDTCFNFVSVLTTVLL